MLASVLPKVFKLGSVVKNAYEWFSFAEEAVTRLGLVKRAAVGAAAAAVIAAPVAMTNSDKIEVTVSVKNPSGAVVREAVSFDPDNVYPAAYLLKTENRTLLQALSNNCRNNPKAVIAQCEQVNIANEKIYFNKIITKAKGNY